MPDITLNTSDGARLAFPCPDGTDVLAAAEEAGLYLPSMCREGTCGACHAHVAEGRYAQAAIGQGVLPDEQTGGVLLCRCQPQSDLVIDLPYPEADIHHQAILPRDATITELTPAGHGALLVRLALTPDDQLGSAADFIPGQYMEVGIPGTTIRRAYSMANLPNWDGQVEFLIRLKPGGAFSTWLAEQARVGDTLQLRGPFGRFVLDETSARPRCFIGGGCGFAPVLAMLRHLAEFQDMQPTTLIFGANHEDELFATDVIDQLQEELPNLTVVLSVWHPQGSWSGFVGTAAEAFASALDQDGDLPDVYVSGPTKLLETVRAVADERGIPPDQLFAEQFQVA